MTTTEPPLTPGEHVWVEAIAKPMLSGDIAIHVLVAGVPDTHGRGPKYLDWRRMPDDTAAEQKPDWTRAVAGGIVSPAADATWTVLDDAEREILHVRPAHTNRWKTPKVAEIITTIHDGQLCTHVTAIEADDAQHIAAALTALAAGTGRPASAAAPLAAGVPVGALTDEPGPGAYLIGDLLAVRFPQDTDDSRWAVQGGIDHDWLTWLAVRERYGDRPMRRLLPHTQPTTATLETTGEPLTLDAIGDVLDARLEAFIERYDRDLSQAREERDELNEANTRLAGDLDLARKDVERLTQQYERARNDRYKLLESLEKVGTERDEARRELRQQSEWNQSQANIIREARRERDALRLRVQRLASEVQSQAESAKRLERLGDDDPPTWRETINQRVHIAQRLRAILAATEQAQTPGGCDGQC